MLAIEYLKARVIGRTTSSTGRKRMKRKTRSRLVNLEYYSLGHRLKTLECQCDFIMQHQQKLTSHLGHLTSAQPSLF